MIEQKRLTAEKCMIRDVLLGKYVAQDGFNPNYVLSSDGRKLARVHVLATVLNTYISDDSKYGFVVLDDGTGMIRAKAFQETRVISSVRTGNLVDVFGRVREYNGERHIYPEIVKVISDPNYETLRKIELVKIALERKKKADAFFEDAKAHKDLSEMEAKAREAGADADELKDVAEAENIKEEAVEEKSAEVDMKAAKTMVLKCLGEIDSGDGVEFTQVVDAVGLPESVTESALDELLSEGSCYEPRPGRVKAL